MYASGLAAVVLKHKQGDAASQADYEKTEP
jgi:hypothetical protein